jgi:hypothetical protein
LCTLGDVVRPMSAAERGLVDGFEGGLTRPAGFGCDEAMGS